MTEEAYTPPAGVNPVYWARIQSMRLLDDELMSAALDQNIPATQLILRIILEKEDLVVTSSTAQREYKNLYGHSVRLDVEATDSEGGKFDIEIQRAKQGADPRRARYHSALLDTHSLREGQTFEQLPTTYVIFITETDYWKRNLPIYHIDRTIRDLENLAFGDCAHILYVNGEYQGDSLIGHLMSDFRTGEPSEMYFPELAERVTALKKSEKGVREMSNVMEITFEEGRQKERLSNLKNIMEALSLSVTDALKALKVPPEDWQRYIHLLETQ